MTIQSTRNENVLTVAPEGRLDTLASPELAEFLKKNYDSISGLILDFSNVSYVSSSGVRVILMAEKAMKEKGGVLIRNANKLVMGVLKVTGLLDIIRVE